MTDTLDLLADIVARARRAGASDADAISFESAAVSVGRRLDKPETLERAESRDLGLRVFIGQRQASVSTSDRSKEAVEALVQRAVAMARAVPEDPYCGLADASMLARDIPDLDLADSTEPPVEKLIELATVAERAALAVPGVTNSDGANAGWSHSDIALVTSNGFAGGYGVSGTSVSVAVLAERDGQMERDYDFAQSVFFADLPDAATIGRKAGERVVRRLGPRKIASSTLPVVFDPRIAAGLLRHLLGAIGGPSIARGTSFLKDRLGQRIFAPGIQIVDDPQIKRGFRSRPFDGEGVATGRRALVEDGVLTSWLLDTRSARQLGLTTTGHASRGVGGPPSPGPTNVTIAPGSVTPAALMSDIKQGLYVTDLMGQGVSLVTGDYSRGAAGFWIENGQLAYPVSEITIAANLIQMFERLIPADDLEIKTGVDTPTVRIDGMTIAGQ
ncbi:MAG: TldD/PmbA family protein [Rhodospirillales bacterium]|nr:TldD/PmbA family protein [Rhodospirillales bacterium]